MRILMHLLHRDVCPTLRFGPVGRAESGTMTAPHRATQRRPRGRLRDLRDHRRPTRRAFGIFPQAFSHLAMIEAAGRIILAERLEEIT